MDPAPENVPNPPDNENAPQNEEDRRKSEAVQHFCDVTGADRNAADERLQKCNYQVDLAVEDFLNVQEGRPSILPADAPQQAAGVSDASQNSDDTSDGEGGPARQGNVLRRRRANLQEYAPVPHAENSRLHSLGPLARRHFGAARPLGWFEWAQQLVFLPFRFVYSTFASIVNFAWSLIFGTGYALLRPFRRLDAAGDPDEDVRNFQRNFRETYGAGGIPRLTEGSYGNLLEKAKADLRFALVYLHSWTHQDCDRFARDTLCYPDLVKFLDENVIFWACDVQSPEGHRVAQALRAATFPCLGLLCLRDGRMSLVARIIGAHSPSDLILALGSAIVDNQPYILATLEQRRQVQIDANLRKEQETAYERAVEEDRQRKEKVQMEQREKIRKEKETELAAERQRQEKEILAQRREELLAGLPAEPTELPYVRVQLKFPDGTRHVRAFRPDCPTICLFNLAFTRPSCPPKFSIWTSYPKRLIDCGVAPDFYTSANFLASGAGAITAPTMSTFADVGIDNDCVLVVQNEEEEEEDDD